MILPLQEVTKMSEKLAHHSHEQEHSHEHTAEHHERVRAHHEAAAEKARAEKSRENLEKIREAAKAEAQEAHHIKHEQTHNESNDNLVGNQHDLKKTAYERTLKRVQSHLSAPVKSFSKFVHNPVVDSVSSVGANTVGRPSGVLGGSIFAFLGSLGLLYYSKHYGFQYNYLFLFILFVTGFAVGAIIELLVWLVFKRRRGY